MPYPLLLLGAIAGIVLAAVIFFNLWRTWAFPLVAYMVIIVVMWVFFSQYLGKTEHATIKVDDFKWLDPATDAKVALHDLSARMALTTVETLKLAAIIYLWFVLLHVLYSELIRSGLRYHWRQLLGLFFLAAIAYLVLLLFAESLLGWIPDPWQTMWLLQDFKVKVAGLTGRDALNISQLRRVLTHLLFVGIIFAELIGGLLIHLQARTADDIRRQLKAASHVIYAMALAQLMHVIHLGVLRLPSAALLNEEQAALVRRLGTMTAITAGSGTIWFILAFALPVVLVLHEKARRLFKYADEATEAEIGQWLKRNGIHASPKHYYVELFAALSPIIAGIPIIQLLIGMFG